MPLVVVPTPIGNLDDMTLRGVEALRAADVIAAEDTRRTIKLLNHYGISKPLVSCHEHNERARTGELVEKMAEGQTVALVSDAGTPGISDPGYLLIQETLSRDLPVDVLPGANALLPALLLSGLRPQPFLFTGFLDGSASERTARLEALAVYPETLVFYISPHGLAGELSEMAQTLGNRPAALVREISKVHQEAIRGTLPQLAEAAQTRTIKGEMVLVVEGCTTQPPESEDWTRVAQEMKNAGIFDKEIAKVLFASYGIARNRIKAFLLNPEAGGNKR